MGVEILVLNGEEQKEAEKELVEDLIAILTSFAGKLYGMRSRKIKNFAKELKFEVPPNFWTWYKIHYKNR